MQTGYSLRILINVMAMAIWLSFSMQGCSKRLSEKDEFLIRVGSESLSVFDYKTAMEISMIAYPNDIMNNPGVSKAIHTQLLNQLVDELMILSEAERLGIGISDNELKSAIENVKSDYPGDEFEKTLLENAIPYASWEKRMKTRFVMEKVIRLELEDKMTVTGEEIKNYLKDKDSGENPEVKSDQNAQADNKKITALLKKEKAEKEYPSWMEAIRERYKDKVEINQSRWKEIVESSGA